MKPIKKIFSIFLVSVLTLFMAGAVSAQVNPVTLNIGSATVDASVNSTVSIDVTVDNPSQIAGAAFTVLYDTEDLTLNSVTSTFFDTFANQFVGTPNEATAPTSVEVPPDSGVIYYQPLITNDITETVTMMGGTMIAAARVQAGSTNPTLFTLTFDLTNAFNGTYPILIIPSIINNTAAGYAAAGEPIPMLVGALDPSIPPESAFPEIPVNMPPDGPLTGSITVTSSTNYDSVTLDINLNAGWNLVSSGIGFNVIQKCSDETKFASAWKWEGGAWAVWIPESVMSVEDLDNYIAGKGFVLLENINCGEGFWVNSNTNQSLTVSGTQPSNTSCLLDSGWNLIGLKSSEAKSITTLISGNTDNIASVWKWDSGAWAVYLPGGGTEAYAESKGFSVLENIEPGEGFWVNCNGAIILQ